MATQPTGMTNGSGVILTVGIVVNNDRCAVVFPLALEASTEDAANRCTDAVQSFVANMLGFMDAVLSSAAFVSFVAAEGMCDGTIPFREDFSPGDYPGTLAAGPAPSNVCGLLTFYEDPADSPPGDRIRLGKNFIPGIPKVGLTGDIIDGSIVGAMQALAQKLQEGFDSVTASGHKWYRVTAAGKPRAAGTALRRSYIGSARAYVVTQRRHLIPR